MLALEDNCIPPTGGRNVLLVAIFFVLPMPLPVGACSEDGLAATSDSLQQSISLDSTKYPIFLPSLSLPRMRAIDQPEIIRGKPKILSPVRSLKLAEEFAAAQGMGIVCMMPAGVIGHIWGPTKTDDLGNVVYGLALAYGGYIIGNALGVAMMGNDEDEQGSFPATLSGSVIGAALSIGAAYLLSERYPKGDSYVGLLIGPSIGGIIGFNLTRQVREPDGQAFVNRSAGKVDVHNSDGKPFLMVCLFQSNF